MPLAVLPLTLPADVASLVAGDVDGDGRDDLVAVARTPAGDAPDRVALTTIRFGADGRPAATSTVELGNRALLWDVKAGLWGVDAAGLVRIAPTGVVTRVASLPTALAALGPTSPVQAPVAHDLDGDGVPELIAWSAGRYHAFRTDGTALGSVPAPAEGDLAVGWEVGAPGLRTTLRPPPLAVADVDGDGRADLALPQGETLRVHFTGATVGVRTATLRLPVDLEPPEPKPGETRRDVSAVWLRDLDGDDKLDLVVQRTVTAGTFFGATTELLYARGTGTGFAAATRIGSPAAAFGVDLADVDGDGDQDVVAPLVDVGMGNLARALVSQQVRVDLALHRWEGAAYAAAPSSLRTLSFFLGGGRTLHAELEADVDGDRRLDLVLSEGEDRVRVFRGEAGGLASGAAWEAAVPIPKGDDALFVHDLTGDGKAEIVVWGPGSAKASVLRVE